MFLFFNNIIINQCFKLNILNEEIVFILQVSKQSLLKKILNYKAIISYYIKLYINICKF